MSIEVRPVGVSCQLACTYCYEEGMRQQQRSHRYDRTAVLASIAKLKKGEQFTLFGGECLILPLKDIDELLSISYQRTQTSGLQTNGALITEKHIDAFIKYKTHVGISLDGPDELNDSRWAGTVAATRKQTAKTHWAIRRLVERAKEYPHLMPSLIITMHAGNCSRERFPRFLAWLHELDNMGLTYINLHTMEMDHKADTLYLSQEDASDRLIDIWNEMPKFKNIRISKFDEILKLLRGDKNSDSVVCHWKPCDPWNTSAVKGIENDGTPSHCSRTNKDGKNWLPAEGDGDDGQHAQFIGHPSTQHFERQLGLYVTPQEYGGCKGCEYWLMCYGQCPGEGETSDDGHTGDWRKRSSHCSTYKKLFAEGARRLRLTNVLPLCDWPNRLEIEKNAYAIWSNSGTSYLTNLVHPTTAVVLNSPPCGKCGKPKLEHESENQAHGDAPHGDAPHGDSHV